MKQVLLQNKELAVPELKEPGNKQQT